MHYGHGCDPSEGPSSFSVRATNLGLPSRLAEAWQSCMMMLACDGRRLM